MLKRRLTIKEAAEILNVSEDLVYGLVKKHRLQSFRARHQTIILREGLNYFTGTPITSSLYPIAVAGDLLKINKITLYRAVKRGEVKALNIGRLFRLQDINGYSLGQSFFSINEAAQYLRINPASVRELIKKKKLKYIKIGDLYRIPGEALKALTGQKALNPLIDIKEATKLLRISRLTLLKYIKEGKLKAFRIGRLYRISEEAISRYQQNKAQAMTVIEFAQALKVSPSLIRRLISRGEIKAEKFGRGFCIKESEINKLFVGPAFGGIGRKNKYKVKNEK